MKRSEMAKTIQYELERIGLNPKVSDIYAESILFRIEVAGMLAPAKKHEYAIDDAGLPIMESKWEPGDAS